MSEPNNETEFVGAPVLSFAQSNPEGPGFWDIAGLLRRVADSLDEIPDVRVRDLVLHVVEGDETADMYVTVYFRIADEAEKERDRLLGRL